MSSVISSSTNVNYLDGFVRDLNNKGRRAAVEKKRQELQERINQVIAQQVGREPGEPKSDALADQYSDWECSKCGTQCKCNFNYNGSYHRTVNFREGRTTLEIRCIRCRVCDSSIKPDLGRLLPKHKIHYYDLQLHTTELYIEGFSFRGIQRHVSRRGIDASIGSFSKAIGQFSEVDINAGTAGDHADAIAADASFWRVSGEDRAFPMVIEVLSREQPLQRDGQQVAWYRTGKVLACGVAEAETEDAWNDIIRKLKSAEFIHSSIDDPLWTVTDGNPGLLNAINMNLVTAVQQRCIWHIANNIRREASAGNKQAICKDVARLFKSNNGEVASRRVHNFHDRWKEEEPEATACLINNFLEGIEYLRRDDTELCPRSTGICERYNQEPKRRLRPMRNSHSDDNFKAIIRLVALRHNCRTDGIDWLAYASRSVWHEPVL